MCCKRIYLIVIASFLLFTVVKGSCLEYGHSCWGAHGKRSGENAVKILQHEAANFRNKIGNGNNAIQANKAHFQGVDGLNNQLETNGIIHFSEDDTGGVNSINFRDVERLKKLFRKHNIKLSDRNSLTYDPPEQVEGLKERWQKLPIFNRRPLTKSQKRNSENELLQQPLKSMAMDDSFYYDFP